MRERPSKEVPRKSKAKETSEVDMGKKIEEACFLLQNEARHHTKLALVKQDVYENGFAMGFTEALRIVSQVRDA
jgi:hypothetical protein